MAAAGAAGCADDPTRVAGPASGGPGTQVVDARPVVLSVAGTPRSLTDAERTVAVTLAHEEVARARTGQSAPRAERPASGHAVPQTALDRVQADFDAFERESGRRVDPAVRTALARAREVAADGARQRAAWERARAAEDPRAGATGGALANAEEAGGAAIRNPRHSVLFTGDRGIVWASMEFRGFLGIQNYTIALTPNTPALNYQPVSLGYRASQYGSPFWFTGLNSSYTFTSPHRCGYNATVTVQHIASNGMVYDPTNSGSSVGDAGAASYSNNPGETCPPPCQAGGGGPVGGGGGGPADYARAPRGASLDGGGCTPVEPPPGTGSGGGGGSNGVRYCLVRDWYDGDGNYMYTEVITCWYQAA